VGNAYIHFAAVSNYFPNPSMLVCPSDTAKKTASHFGNSSQGFSSLGYNDNALSYIAGLHAENGWPREILSGDRNIRTSASGGPTCGKIGVTALSLLPGDPSVKWTNFHNATGNLLLTDGSVRTLSSVGLQQAVNEARQEIQTHVLIPGLPYSAPE
jgi:hypothetical protein